MNISRFSFHNAHGVVLIALFLSVLGAVAYHRMAAAILPDFPFPRLVVIVSAGDMAIQDMVIRVTRPLESASNSVPGAKRVVSKTSRGAIELSIDFNWGTDMFEAFSRLNAAIAQIRSSLPQEASIQVEWVNPSSFPILGYSITSSHHSARELNELATLTMAPYLSRLDGVYRILVQGGEVREYRVLVNPQALAAAGLTLAQVSTAIADTNRLQSVGRFSRHYQSYLVLATAQIEKLPQILDIVVSMKGGVPVRVRDIATVQEADEERQQIVTADGHEAVLLNVLKQQGASTADVSRKIKDAIQTLRRSNAMPSQINFRPFYDEAELLHDSLGSLVEAIVIGAILGFLVLLLFLRSLRSTLIVFLCLPMTVAISFLLLHLFRQTLNIMTLGGLAVGLGLIIDDVMVTLENIFRLVEGGESPSDAAIDGPYEIQKPMIGSTLTSIAVFVPLAFLPGITGAFFAPLSITLAVLLIVSILLAVTFVPIVCARFITSSRSRIQNDAGEEAKASSSGPGSQKWFLWVRDKAYPSLMDLALLQPIGVLLVAIGVVFLSLIVFFKLPTGFMPEMDEGSFVLDYLAPAGTTLEDTDRLCRTIETELRKTPEVASYARRTGLELGFFVTDPNRGDVSVKLLPRSRRSHSMREVMDDVRHRCETLIPSVTFEAIAPLADRVADIAGEPSPIEVKVFGDDPKVLARLSGEIEEIVSKVRGTTESVHEIVRSGPELTVRIDPHRASLIGVTPNDVMQALQTAMFGNAETAVISGERLIRIRVMYPKSIRRTMEQIRELPLWSRGGQPVPLESVARIREEPGYFEITRENQKPMVPITAQLENRDLGSANEEVQQKIAKSIKLPEGYTIQYGGIYQTQQDSFRALLMILLLGMALVFIVMVCQYRRFLEAFVLMVCAICSLAGGIFALFISGADFNASSFTGTIMIFGLVLTNGIYLMDMARNKVADGVPLRDAVIQAGQMRIRPILMTTSIAVLALLPLVFGVGAGAEMQKPLAIASVGGLAFSPLFTLLLAPTLFHLLSSRTR